jgi:hypothetical protein
MQTPDATSLMTAELNAAAEEALEARQRGVGLADAVHDNAFPALSGLHRDLRDAMLAELPEELASWVSNVQSGDVPAEGLANAQFELFTAASAGPTDAETGDEQRDSALAEVLLFESVRLRLLATAWSSADYERVGGDEDRIDELAWGEVEAILATPQLAEEGIRPLPLMIASASVAMLEDAEQRAAELRYASEDTREQLRMQARLRSALRELRLPESVLLSNAMANLLGESRQELPELQGDHALALEGLTRQAMDQRVSRGRRALLSGPEKWPKRKRPALFDLLRNANADEDLV